MAHGRVAGKGAGDQRRQREQVHDVVAVVRCEHRGFVAHLHQITQRVGAAW